MRRGLENERGEEGEANVEVHERVAKVLALLVRLVELATKGREQAILLGDLALEEAKAILERGNLLLGQGELREREKEGGGGGGWGRGGRRRRWRIEEGGRSACLRADLLERLLGLGSGLLGLLGLALKELELDLDDGGDLLGRTSQVAETEDPLGGLVGGLDELLLLRREIVLETVRARRG